MMKGLSSEIDAIHAKLERAVRQESRDGIVSAYLFGSRAEGRSHRESDVDVAVLLRLGAFPTPRARFEERVRLTSRLAATLGGLTADVVVLNDCPPGLARRVVTRGERFYSSDCEADHAFVCDVQLRAADLAPFLKRTRRLKLQAIRR